MVREFTPEDIRRIGNSSLPAVASSYDELRSLVAEAKSAAEAALDAIPEASGESLRLLWDRFTIMAEESPDTIAAMSQTLVEIADRYDADEEQTVLDLNEAFADLDDVYVDNVEEVNE